MRTNIEIDDELMRAAMEASGAKTKKAAVQMALELLLKELEQEQARQQRRAEAWKGILELVGKVKFEKDYLEEMRSRKNAR